MYSHWLSTGPGQGLGSVSGRMGCMILRRIFHIAPEQGQEPEQEQGRMSYVPIFQVLKLFQMVCLMIFQWLSGVQSWPQTQPV